MGAENSTRADETGPAPSAGVPPDISLIVILGLFSALFGFFSWVGALGSDGVSPALTLGMLSLAAGQVVAMLGLARRRSWAPVVTVAVYGVTAAVDLGRGDAGGVLLAVVVAGYVWYRRELFEP